MRDYASYMEKDVIDKEVSDFGLKQLDIDNIGLDAVDRRMLVTMADVFSGGPVGLETLAATTGEPRGRMLTKRAFEHLGLPMPEDYIARTRGGAKPSAPDNITIEEWTANNGGGADN